MNDVFKEYRNRKHPIVYQHSLPVQSNELVCGYCGHNIAPHDGYKITIDTSTDSIQHIVTIGYIYECPHCKNPIIYFPKTKISIPGAKYGRDVKNLPPNIKTLYDECRICYANQCYTSAQMIARTLLMHIAVEQGAEENKNFAYYVEFLDTHGFIPPNGKKWVDFIRTSGNVANHEIVIKDMDETKKVLSFLSALLMFIYELPNELPD